jgi:6-pyruvoyltetrahydropterin/6-carboxytetrahydropterin synthase
VGNDRPTIELFTRVYFSAAHSYRDRDKSPEENLKKYGIYSKIHGHNYEVVIGLRGPVDAKTGMIINFFDVQKIMEDKILSVLDISHLEDDIPWFNDRIPSTENITRFIYYQLKHVFRSPVSLFSVEVKESNDLGAKIIDEQYEN